MAMYYCCPTGLRRSWREVPQKCCLSHCRRGTVCSRASGNPGGEQGTHPEREKTGLDWRKAGEKEWLLGSTERAE